ncbi:ABC transporter [Candidatus Kaiserbacteria bacterium RIFCSPLOWO2_12_FULL_53_8]|uniref:Transport permease protein n=2 Tax=Candidatus Kaiseribacteriota TaxID=1752734 RepID=A0A1F6CUH2_9BACT|nr:MAG: ABC transporter [Candidatus Kaiserbacteria bacterium RIFCSPHIGHO2_01_FULL_53_29]OGG91853.1 MAG: ABC transporter [Candidatus Kaiserbacteria bacterium RIFCSPLOWO2_12_FULL_53_8]
MNEQLKRWNPWWTLTDLLTMVERNLTRYRRVPQLLIFSTIQPVMFLLLFTYVFGGAIRTAGGSYINYLLPGILAQSAVFGAIQTGVGLSEDLTKGIIDRFKSLPMARSAVLLGRTVADMMRNIFVIILMFAVGYGIGFRLGGTWSDALAAFAILLLFGFAFSWVSASIGMLVKNTETAQVAGFIWVFPLVFASAVFVPVESMPDWLQAFAKVNPVTVTVNAVRALLLDNATDIDRARYCAEAIGWIVVILIVFMPLAIWLYRKSE